MKAVRQWLIVSIAVVGMALMGCGDDSGSGSQTSGDDTTTGGDTASTSIGTTEGTTDEGTTTEGTTEGTTDEGTTTEGTTDEGTTTEGTTTEGTATEGTTTEGTTEGTTDEGTTTEGTTDGTAECENPPSEFSDYMSHIISMELSGDSGNLACDSNNDGTVDEKDGDLNTILTSGIAAALNLNDSIAKGIVEGDLFLNVELAGYTGEDTEAATINFYLGDADNSTFPSSCDDTKGDGTVCDVSIDPVSFDGDCKPKVTLPNASISGGTVTAGPQTFSFALPLGPLTLELAIDNGRFYGDIDGKFNMSNGRLCGQVQKSTILDAIEAACENPTPDTQTLCGLKGAIPAFITCETCTLVLSMDGAETNVTGVSN